MIRFTIQCLFVLLLSVLEVSFFGSLHGMARFTPVVFGMSVYLYQHHRLATTWWWPVAHGVLLDVQHISAIPLMSVSYAVAALIAALTARRVFSHRSVYGVVACAVVSYLGFAVTQALFLVIGQAIQKHEPVFLIFLSDTKNALITLVIFLLLLFVFAKRVRRILERSFVIPASKQTY